jgi:DnaJ-domain-containing protein 1
MSRLLREPFLRLALAVVLADGVVRRPEADLLLFLADLLELSREEFEGLFLEAAGRPFPRRWGGSGRPVEEERVVADDRDPRRSALAVLGLAEPADREAVRRAYRELAAAHHPDRFAALGPEAVEAARIGFLRVRQAYEVLEA